MKSLRTHIIDTLERENKAYKKTMLKNKKVLKDPKTEEFLVVVTLGFDICEPPRIWFGKGITLKDAFQNARNSFDDEIGQEANVNNGNSHDGFRYKVDVTLRGGLKIEVPHIYWKRYEWKNKKEG